MKLTLAKAKEIMELNDGNLDLSYSDVTSLPDGLKVQGYLDLSGTRIEKLPENLVVGDWLDISETNITSLPNNLSVGLDIILTMKI